MTSHRLPEVLGLFDVWGFRCKVARSGDIRYPLTPCCEASGKGLMDDDTGEGYVGCRSCYHEVDPLFGTCWVGDEWADALAGGGVTKVR